MADPQHQISPEGASVPVSGIEISPASPAEPEAAAMIRRHLSQMAAQSPEDSCHALDGSGLAEARGSGAGRAMLDFLLALARRENATGIYLETGSTDDYLPSRRLYESFGFVQCGPFADYGEDPWSVFMHLDLRAAA